MQNRVLENYSYISKDVSLQEQIFIIYDKDIVKKGNIIKIEKKSNYRNIDVKLLNGKIINLTVILM